jgi:hypothetical protein
MKTIHVHIALWVILLVGGFLLGFVPEYRKNRELAAQLESPLKTIDALKLQLELGELRDDAGLCWNCRDKITVWREIMQARTTASSMI